MVETDNDERFRVLTQGVPLEEVLEILTITRTHLKQLEQPDPSREEIASSLTLQEMNRFIARFNLQSQLIIGIIFGTYYFNHQKECDEAIARFYTGESI